MSQTPTKDSPDDDTLDRLQFATPESDRDVPWSWHTSGGAAEVSFLGRSSESSDRTLEQRLASYPEFLPPRQTTAWLEQIHSARVLEARPGCCGPGDALVTTRPGIALAVVTADCLPIVVAGERWLAVIHAGWRGLVAGIIAATLEHPSLEKVEEPPSGLRAWIGPAIGPCCYEVGDDVARQITAVSHERVARQGPRGKPHLDLPAAAELQLVTAGIEQITRLDLCTRCHCEKLWSYRVAGKGAGRNVALAWRREEPT